jgi:hypothetical protein
MGFFTSLLLALFLVVYMQVKLETNDFALPIENTHNWPDFRQPLGKLQKTTLGVTHYMLVGEDTDPLVFDLLLHPSLHNGL